MTDEEKAAAAKAEADAKIAADAETALQAEIEKNPALKARFEALSAGAKAAEDYKKDMLKFKTLAQQTEEAKAKEKAAAEAAHLEELKKAGNFQALYEASEKRAADEKNARTKEARQYINDLRFSEVTRAALAAGLLPAAQADLGVLDLTKVEASRSESGTVTFANVSAFVEEMKTTRPHWFGTGKAPNLNLSKPGGGNEIGGGKTYTDTELLALETTDPVEYRRAVSAQYFNQKA